MSEKTKKQTLKTVNLDIERITAQIEKKKASLLSLQQKIKGLEAQLKECNEIRNQLTREGVQQQVNTWFRDKSIQPEQLGKIVSVITQLKDKINDLDESDIVEAVRMIADDRKNSSTEKPVVNDNADKNS